MQQDTLCSVAEADFSTSVIDAVRFGAFLATYVCYSIELYKGAFPIGIRNCFWTQTLYHTLPTMSIVP